MGTHSEDFSTYSIENPISGGGDWEATYNGGIRIVDNGGTNMAATNNAGGEDAHNLKSTAVAYSGTKQYAEVTLNSVTEEYGLGPTCFASTASGGSCYGLRLRSFATWGSTNRFITLKSGSLSAPNWLGAGVSSAGSGDKLGLLVEDDEAGTTTLSFYFNPTAYDGDGFPTDGFELSYDDTSSNLTSGQTGLWGYSISTGGPTHVSSLYTAGTTAGPSVSIPAVLMQMGEL